MSEDEELNEEELNEIAQLLKEQFRLANAEIIKVRKTSPNRFDEVRALLAKLKESVSGDTVTDEAQKIFADIKTLWLENLPENNAFYERTLYEGWYSEAQNLSEEETKVLCLIRDTNTAQYKKFENELQTNYRAVIEKIFIAYAAHPVYIPAFVKDMFAELDDNDEECIYVAFLEADRFEDEIKSLFSPVEKTELVTELCSVLAIPNDFDKIDMELLQLFDNGGDGDVMNLQRLLNNSDLCVKLMSDAEKKIPAHIRNNTLSDEQINALFAIMRKTFLHSHVNETWFDDIWIWQPFFNILPMAIRNEVLGTEAH